MDESSILQVSEITGSSYPTAKTLLEAAGGNVNRAVQLHFENPDMATSSSASSKRPLQRDVNQESKKKVSKVSKEDDIGEDGVRRPIKPKMDRLIPANEGHYLQYGFNRRMNTRAMDPFRNFLAEAQQQDSISAQASKLSGLSNLFKPPLELIEPGDLEEVKAKGRANKKWILVNIQKFDEFASQVLNRDIWAHPQVKEIILEHFIFWQRPYSTPDGETYIRLYKLDGFPHLAILDPRTGTRLKILPSQQTVASFLDQVWEFLGANSLGGDPIQRPAKQHKNEGAAKDNVIDLTGDDLITISDSESDNNYVSESDNDVVITEPNENKQPAALPEASSSDSKKELPPEPAEDKSDPSICTVRFTFPDSSKVQRRFTRDNTLGHLVDFIAGHGYSKGEHELLRRFPSQNLSEMNPEETLESVGIKHEALHVKPVNKD
eukprot:m.21325 g.21325  ORF g.21325 m.21325 type:complete len:435 (+) comp7113_c0_seq1:238-1542(+)